MILTIPHQAQAKLFVGLANQHAKQPCRAVAKYYIIIITEGRISVLGAKKSSRRNENSNLIIRSTEIRQSVLTSVDSNLHTHSRQLFGIS